MIGVGVRLSLSRRRLCEHLLNLWHITRCLSLYLCRLMHCLLVVLSVCIHLKLS